MDVTPFSKFNPMMSTPKSGAREERSDMDKSADDDILGSAVAGSLDGDPVKRAEEAIGAFFADERFPSGRFSIDQDKDSGRYVYRLVDRETDEVLKQFPGDYVLRRVAFYRELQGLAVNNQV
ncbi:MAG: flagellar protein FlaG [Sneathiella sp.]